MAERRTLNTRLIFRTVVAMALLSAAAMMVGGQQGNRALVTAAAAFFAFVVSIVAVLVNFEIWRLGRSRTARAGIVRSFIAIQRNSMLAAIAYGWGALAMQGLYITPLTGLWWQHCWQYALAMLLLCGGCILFGVTLRAPLRSDHEGGTQLHFRLAWPLASVQAAVATGGLSALAISGKLSSEKVDWAANRVFAALAISILAISVVSLVSMARARLR